MRGAVAINRGDVSEISTYIEQALENDFSGNVIDVCPVGALTDRTFRFAARVWFTNPMDAHRDCPTCSWCIGRPARSESPFAFSR